MAGLSTPKQKLSALVITYNEMGYIERCIGSISFADEIIVVDSFSTDGTYEYLMAHPKVKVIQNPFENFTAQKSFTLKQATNDWVLFLDADEVVTEALQKEITATINNPEADEAYWFYRKFLYIRTICTRKSKIGSKAIELGWAQRSAPTSQSKFLPPQ